MSPQLLGSQTLSKTDPSVDAVAGVTPATLQARAAALTSALESGAGCLPLDGVARAEAAIAKTVMRTSLAGGRTVVAFAGATGSGKSSLFNVLSGAEVAQVGARRPTTSKPSAAVWGDGSASALLDWLLVGARHMVEDEVELDGLVLLDLPDFDSQSAAHRLEADRVLDLVHVFIWVTDPQKYADARLHDEYITKLSAHDAVTITVLNQADRLTPDNLAACRTDLLRLLSADGVADAEVIAVSARDGDGVGQLRRRIDAIVRGRNASVERLDSDLRAAAHDLRSGVAESEPNLAYFTDASLFEALSRAAGIPVILEAVERDFRRETRVCTGWPVTRWVRALRPAQRKLRGLDKDEARRAGAISPAEVRSVLGRSSFPAPTPAARAAVALATRDLGSRTGRELPQPWSDAVTEVAIPPGQDLADALDQEVAGTSLRGRDPFWWSSFGFAQWIFVAIAVVGMSWLVVLTVLDWLRLPPVDSPALGPVPYPTLMFLGGLLIGYLLSLLTRAFGRVGARRRKVLVAARLQDSVAKVVRDRLVSPVQQVVDRHRMTREYLETASQPA